MAIGNMNYYIIDLYLIILISSSAISSKVLRPRGVSLSMASLYDPARPFSCFDGSGTMPFNHVNDDYCDCKDGSDEPGTAACINGSFHCNNMGHIGKEISSAFVNDGVCDCCDASDEYASAADCVDMCLELGEVARQEAIQKAKIQLEGYHLRQKMAERGVEIKKENQAKLEELQKEKEKAELDQAEKKERKEEAEIPEKEALEKYKTIEAKINAKKEEEKTAKDKAEAINAFSDLDEDGDGTLTVQELQMKEAFDTNKDGTVSEEEARFYLHHKDSIDLEFFLSTGWTYIRPPYKYGKSMFLPPSTSEPPTVEEPGTDESEDGDIPEQVEDVRIETTEGADYDTTIGLDQEEEMDEEEEEEEEEGEEYAEEIEDPEVSKMKEVDAEDEIKYDEDTQRLIDIASAARDDFNSADQHLRDIIKEIQNIEEGLEKDFGPNEEFRTLEGECYEFTDREYTYRLCPFSSAIQKPISGHSETRLGSWGSWVGPSDNLYSAMKYTGGQACWNGPQRSAEVRLLCDVDTQLIAVSEPNRCEYLFVFTTPAVCTPPENISDIHLHTEL